jgi:hypothetical protein
MSNTTLMSRHTRFRDVHEWFTGFKIASSVDSLLKVPKIDLTSNTESEALVMLVHGPYKVGDSQRLEYTEDDFKSICTGGTDKTVIGEGYVKAIVEEQKYDEYQMVSFDKTTKEATVAGVAYTYDIPLGPTLTNFPVYFKFDRQKTKFPKFIKSDEEKKKFLTRNYKKARNFLRQFEKAMMIQLICSPIRKSGFTRTFIEEVAKRNVYDVVILTAIQNKNTIEAYKSIGFQPYYFYMKLILDDDGDIRKEYIHDIDDGDLLFMYLPLNRITNKRMKIGAHCELDF